MLLVDSLTNTWEKKNYRPFCIERRQQRHVFSRLLEYGLFRKKKLI